MERPSGVVVLLVDDHPVVRRGMTAMLSGQDWIARLVEAGTVDAAIRCAVTESPDVAVVDLGLPDGDGVGLIRRLRHACPRCAVLVLTMTGDPGSVRACLEAGAGGYLVKEAAPESLVPALRTVLDGGLVLGPGAATEVLTRVRTRVPTPFDVLTPRELQHVLLLAAGHGGPEIARQLRVAEKTARNQMAAILAKTGAADRVQVALLARDSGLLDDRP